MKIISSCFRSLCFLFFFPIEFLFSIAGIRVFHCHSTISLCVWSDGDSFFFFVYQQIENTILHSLSFSSIFFLFTFLIFIPCVWFFCYVLFGSACFSIHASVFFSVSCFVWSSPVITYSFRTNLFFCHFVALIKDYDQCWFYLNSLLFFYRLPFNVYLSLMPVFNFRTTQTDDDDDDDDYSLHFFIIAIISAIVLCS